MHRSTDWVRVNNTIYMVVCIHNKCGTSFGNLRNNNAVANDHSTESDNTAGRVSAVSSTSPPPTGLHKVRKATEKKGIGVTENTQLVPLKKGERFTPVVN